VNGSPESLRPQGVPLPPDVVLARISGTEGGGFVAVVVPAGIPGAEDGGFVVAQPYRDKSATTTQSPRSNLIDNPPHGR
jgi:hypothetical protein